MVTTPGHEPWDAAAMTEALVAQLRTLRRERLDRIELPTQPGVYAQFFAAPHLADRLGELVATGRAVAYVGVAATSLRERVGRYRTAVAGMAEVTEASIHLAVLPCSCAASAVFAEAALIERLDPLLQGTGLGSQQPGSGRPGKRASTIDALLPGRRSRLRPSDVDGALARVTVLRRLVRQRPDGPKWAALPVAGPRRSGASRHG